MRNIRRTLWVLAAALLLLGACGNEEGSDSTLFAAEGEGEGDTATGLAGDEGQVVCEMVCEPDCEGRPTDENTATDPDSDGQWNDDCCREVCRPVEPPCSNEMRCDQECVAAYQCIGWDEQRVMERCCEQTTCRPDDTKCYEVERCDEACLANIGQDDQPQPSDQGDDLWRQCCQIELVCEPEPQPPCQPTTECDWQCFEQHKEAGISEEELYNICCRDHCIEPPPPNPCDNSYCCRDSNCCGAQSDCCADGNCCGGMPGCCDPDRCNRCNDDGRCCSTDSECPSGACGNCCEQGGLPGCCDPNGGCEPPPPPPEPCTNEEGGRCCDPANPEGSCEPVPQDCTDENGERRCDADGNCWC